jgi:hypothetical protein
LRLSRKAYDRLAGNRDSASWRRRRRIALRLAIAWSTAMPRFTILSTDQSYSATEITALDAGAVLNIVGRLDCKDADVLADGRYSFSVRLNDCGMWSVFQRDDFARPKNAA